MEVKWTGRPSGKHNKRVEVDYGEAPDYYFSLCTRQDADDPHAFHVFAYRTFKGGYLHIGAAETAEECREMVTAWEDPYADDPGFGRP